MNSPAETRPSVIETALGGLLQDIGKFMQRAFGALRAMDVGPRALESSILPTDGHGGYTHKHALWSEAFFHWLEKTGLSFPGGINAARVRDMAVFHHCPERLGALGWLAAEADRLSSGMDRKAKDAEFEAAAESPGGWDRFIKTAMLSPFCPIDLGLGDGPPPRAWQPLGELRPDEGLMPVSSPDASDYPAVYKSLWQSFTAELPELFRIDNLDLFCSGLLSLSERYTWAIPSSTVDLPDISLHDHSRTVAAIAAVLYAWHVADGSLDDERAVRDRAQPKFRFLAGDLSGIQSSLFALANQQVKGVSRILRARSFLFGEITEAAVLLVRERLGLTPFNLIQNAGGRFVLLIPDLAENGAPIAALRAEIDAWMRERYIGELALNLAVSAPFAGTDFLPPRFRTVFEDLGRALEEAKLRRFRAAPTGIVAADYANGECQACGCRPGLRERDGVWRCAPCDEEQRVGGLLPHVVALSWRKDDPRKDGNSVRFFGDLRLRLHTGAPGRASGVLDGARLYRGPDTVPGPWPLRFVANHVPTFVEGDEQRPEYRAIEETGVVPDQVKTFAHLAAEAREIGTDGELVGEPFLAVLKADVDRLGIIFAQGLSDPRTRADRATLGRYAALSRMFDLFFTGYLSERLRRRFPSTYTVYAGGDDLLLIGPWRQTIDLAHDLRAQFRAYVATNPNITLSAGIELIKPNQPLNRAAGAAEQRLESAKSSGRDRVSLIDAEPLPWDRLGEILDDAAQLDELLRSATIPTALAYRLLYFAGQRRLAEHDPEAASWRARWGYHLARNVRKRFEQDAPPIEALLNHLLGLDTEIRAQTAPPPTAPVVIALYRNR